MITRAKHNHIFCRDPRLLSLGWCCKMSCASLSGFIFSFPMGVNSERRVCVRSVVFRNTLKDTIMASITSASPRSPEESSLRLKPSCNSFAR